MLPADPHLLSLTHTHTQPFLLNDVHGCRANLTARLLTPTPPHLPPPPRQTRGIRGKSRPQIRPNNMQIICIRWRERDAIMLTAVQAVLVVIIIIIISMIIIIPNILISVGARWLRGAEEAEHRGEEMVRE